MPNQDEWEALSTIFDNCKILSSAHVQFTFVVVQGTIKLDCRTSCKYPELQMPEFELSLPPIPKINTHQLVQFETQLISEVDRGFRGMFKPGEVVIFEWVEWLKTYLSRSYKAMEMHHEAEKKVASIISEGPNMIIFGDHTTTCPTIYHAANPIMEKKSTFIAHLAQVNSLEEARLVKRTLLNSKICKAATHNVSAYRIFSGSMVQKDCDDDGETHAGGRLMHLLDLVDARNVTVIVSRWYGGVQLGPSRFKLINQAARLLLEEHGYIKKL